MENMDDNVQDLEFDPEDLLHRAEAGDPDAQVELGCRFLLGEGLPRSPGKASRWLQRAAAQGNAAARLNLGFMAQRGVGTPWSPAQAKKWYESAAAQGDARGACALGRLYEEGLSVPEDAVRALEWYRLAAEQGDPEAQYRCGRLLAEGRGTRPEAAEALKWCRRAARQGLAEAQYELGCRHLYGDGVDRSTEEAEAWFRRVLEAEDPERFLDLGLRYRYRVEGRVNRRRCRLYAWKQLRSMGAVGRGLPRDEAEAAAWDRLAAEEGDADARFRLGLATLHGRGVSPDAAAGVRWLRLAAEQGFARAMFALGWLTETGEIRADEAVDPAGRLPRAAQWYGLAAERHCAAAQLRLGLLYRDGKGVGKDRNAAEKWFHRVRHGSDPFAKVLLELVDGRGGTAFGPVPAGDPFFPEDGPPAPGPLGDVNRGLLLRLGLPLPEGPGGATEYFHRAAQRGDVRGQFLLGLAFETGDGRPRELREAARWYRLSADNGYAPARSRLGALCGRWGLGRDARHASSELLRQAAEQGDAEAQCRFGRMHEYGRGTPPDPLQAMKWYLAAAEQGAPDGKRRLESLVRRLNTLCPDLFCLPEVSPAAGEEGCRDAGGIGLPDPAGGDESEADPDSRPDLWEPGEGEFLPAVPSPLKAWREPRKTLVPEPRCRGCGREARDVRVLVASQTGWHLCDMCIDDSFEIVHADADDAVNVMERVLRTTRELERARESVALARQALSSADEALKAADMAIPPSSPEPGNESA